ncbi:MAG: DUF559 domain-containing protein [Chloroflexi bacterium]|nr:DUF559 domain-containing protein [Chloroflexota bacterium]
MTRKTRGKPTASAVQSARTFRKQMTEAEKKLWDIVRDRRVARLKFRRQHPFGPYILDFFCVEHQLEVEADGGIHLSREQMEHDEQRKQYLEKRGVRILRFKNEEIMKSPTAVVKKILQTIHSPSPDTVREKGPGDEL